MTPSSPRNLTPVILYNSGFYSPLLSPLPPPSQTEESEDDAVDTDFDASEEDEVRETEREAAEEEPKRKRKQWLKPARPQVGVCVATFNPM
jgi:hypothetical protein